MPTTKRPKPLLVGELNPYGSDPQFALYPAPDGCSGHRLCRLVLGMTRRAYLDSFERVNLCEGRWSMYEASKRMQEYRTHGAAIILLGAKVSAAFEITPYQPFTLHDGGKTLVLPHPSGLCRLWNEPRAFERARGLVARVAPEVAHLLGVIKDE